MTKPETRLSREEKLATKLKENIKRRKAQVRARTTQSSPPSVDAPNADTTDSPKSNRS